MRLNPIRKSGPDVRRVRLAVFAAAALLGLSVYPTTVHAQKMQRLGGERYLIESVMRASSKGLRGLMINGPPSLSGELVLQTTRGDSVRIEAARVLKAASIEDAELFAGEITTTLRDAENALILDIKTPPEGASWQGTNWSARYDLTVTIPEGWDLEVYTSHFDCDIVGPLRSAHIRTEYGRVILSDVTERTEVNGTHTAIELRKLRGEITANTSYQDIIVSDVITSPEQAATFSNQFGRITIDELAGAVAIKSEYTPIQLTGIVLVKSVSRIRSEEAPLILEIAEFNDAKFIAQNSNAGILITVPKDISSRLSFSVGRGGSIHTRGVDVMTYAGDLGPGFLEGTCGNGAGVLDLEIEGSGKIELIGR